MLTISLLPKKSQSVTVNLDGQNCTIRLIQYASYLYLDLISNGKPVVLGVPCQYANRLIRYRYRGFRGDLCFLDTQGGDDPHWEGLGSRWLLYYSTEEEING
ncbi:hypothetical protein OS580_001464 [Escherichia coli]|nr:hypothetical protein [Escherichia coli]